MPRSPFQSTCDVADRDSGKRPGKGHGGRLPPGVRQGRRGCVQQPCREGHPHRQRLFHGCAILLTHCFSLCTRAPNGLSSRRSSVVVELDRLGLPLRQKQRGRAPVDGGYRLEPGVGSLLHRWYRMCCSERRAICAAGCTHSNITQTLKVRTSSNYADWLSDVRRFSFQWSAPRVNCETRQAHHIMSVLEYTLVSNAAVV